MKSVVSFFENCRLGKKQAHHNLTLFPLLSAGTAEPYYLTLEQAIDKGLLLVTEIDTDGNVNRLKLRNNARQPIMLVEGEELKGAKQNRVVNASFLIAGKTVTTIPVSCVEERRWRYDTRKFSSGQKVMHASLRREAQYCLRDSLSRGDGHRTDQGRIWASISEKSRRMNVDSPTMAMSDVFTQVKDRLAAYTERFHLIERQVGALFAIDGQVIGLECFGCEDTFARFFDKLVASYAMDAVETDTASRPAPPAAPAKARAFIESVKKARGERHPVVSVGATVSFQSRAVAGTALADGQRMLHLSAFRKDRASGGDRVGFQRFMARRARHTRPGNGDPFNGGRPQ
jgi:hypothetical protein